MSSNSKQQNIIQQTPANTKGKARVDLVKSDFDALVETKGYDVYHDRAIKCPCRTKDNGSALPSCRNCGGVGWLWINRTQTKVVLQSMNRDTVYKDWSEEKLGTARVTARHEEQLAYMDRLTLIDAEITTSQVVFPKNRFADLNTNQVEYVGKTVYDIKRILDIFVFDEPSKQLIQLTDGVDYTIDSTQRNVITLSDEFNTWKNITLSIRYVHSPSFHIIDMSRDVMATDVKDTSTGGDKSVLMPIHAIARRAHYVLDEEDFNGLYLFDNSYTDCSDKTSTPKIQCSPVRLLVNGVFYETVNSGVEKDLIILDTNNTPQGTPEMDGTIRVPAPTSLPAQNQVNGVAKIDIPSGGSKNFKIQDSGGNPVTVTQISDSATEFVGEVDVVTERIYVRDFWQAGDQETTINGSLGWYLQNTSIFNDNQPTSGLAVKLDPNDDTKLSADTPNRFGNLNRVTNDRGGQNYDDVGGGLTSDGATANVMLDNYTNTIVYRQSVHAGTEHWNDSVLTAQAFSVPRYDGSTYNQWQMLTPKLIQHYLTGDGQNSHIFDSIDQWSDEFHWIMGLAIGGSTCYFWRENQPWNATNLFNSFSRTSVNSGIDLIVWANAEDYV